MVTHISESSYRRCRVPARLLPLDRRRMSHDDDQLTIEFGRGAMRLAGDRVRRPDGMATRVFLFELIHLPDSSGRNVL